MWTDAELDSLHMVADGVSLAAHPSSSVDFFNGGTMVAYITRNVTPSTTATMTCKGGAFGSGVEYAISYLGWEEPSMPSVVAIPTLPQTINGTDRTLYLRKGDGSNWTENDARNLVIKIGNDTCNVVPNDFGYSYTINGTEYCYIRGSLISGPKIPITCVGEDGEEQPMSYTITSIQLGSAVESISYNSPSSSEYVNIPFTIENGIAKASSDLNVGSLTDLVVEVEVKFNMSDQSLWQNTQISGSLNDTFSIDGVGYDDGILTVDLLAEEVEYPVNGSLNIEIVYNGVTNVVPMLLNFTRA